MVQDFAKDKVRASPRQPQTSPAPPAWGMLAAGLLTGTLLGVFVSFLAYISGAVPGRPGDDAVATAEQTAIDEAAQTRLTEELDRAAARLQLEFYQELPNYEVVVDATPLVPAETETGTTEPVTPESTPPVAGGESMTEDATRSSGGYMVQAGAFQQENSARARRDQLTGLGLDARVKQEALLGRTLYLVQAGPYPDREALGRAERVLRSNNIESMRISPGR
ncbi:MAG: SPOR domain-containing protein [Pseudohongiellaceae bacterium]